MDPVSAPCPSASVHAGQPDLADDDPPPNNCFAFTPTQLHTLVKLRNLAALDAFGGLPGLAAGLRTDVLAGLNANEAVQLGTLTFDEAVAAGREGRDPSIDNIQPRSVLVWSGSCRFADRRRIFGTNQLPRRRHKSFLKLLWVAFNDKLLILLTITAFISVAIGIYRSLSSEFGTSSIEWVDGCTVIVAIIVIVLASAFNDWQQNHRFEKLNERSNQRKVTVVRSAKPQRIWAHHLLVGDILHIEAGDVLAVDGVLVQAAGLHVDESSISGESAPVRKTTPADHNASHAGLADPFILSGTIVTCGVGRYLVTSVGAASSHGRTLMSLREDVEETPLQAKLGRLGKQLIAFGAVVGSFFFVILFIRYLANLKRTAADSPAKKAEAFFQIVTISITLVIIAVPEGLALNVTVALAFAAKRMLKDNNLVRLIRSCEIMGNVTSVCSDKTGTLTQNKMKVVVGRIGADSSFDDLEAGPGDGRSRRTHTSARLAAALSEEVKDLVKGSMALNSTAFESDDPAAAASGYLGSSTETALLVFCRDRLGMGPLREERANSPIVAMLPFESSRKWMAVLVRLPEEGRYRLLVKGAAEVVFEFCAYVVCDVTDELAAERLSEDDRTGFRLTIQSYAEKTLRPVAIAYRDFDASEVFESEDDDPADVNLEWLASGLFLIGVFGIRDPLRDNVEDSVRKCQAAGVFVRMVTGDNFLTATAVAAQSGIYTPGGVAMDGPTFRRLSPSQLDAVIPRLQVLARSSPEDKLLLVSHLRAMKEIVAVTGDGTNDALALKAADVGLAMGMQGTEVAKEAASIILLDDNFASIVKALSWGRTVNDSVKKFCQFQFTINISASILTVSVLVGLPIFTVVQLLWINLIMDIFASLGLATDLPSPECLHRGPEPRNAPIISITMWKMILGQSIYQLAVVFTVHFAGWDIFNPDSEFEIEKLQTLVFNIYVWMQFFNQHNCRRVDNKLDIWYNVLRNPWFIGVQLITLVGQFVIIFKGGEAFDTVPLTGAQWGWSLLFGLLTLPLGALLRQVPDRYVLKLFRLFHGVFMAVVRSLRILRACLFGSGRRRRERHDGIEGGRPTANDDIEAAPTQAAGELSTGLGRSSVESQSQDESGKTCSSEGSEDRVDLQALIDAARVGRVTGRDRLELHPETLKDDPILGRRSNVKLPPSQDPALQIIETGDGDGARGCEQAATTSRSDVEQRGRRRW
ncbi:calcium-translocating P-type ATPase, PMCA-type [Ophiocordyceps camponoti-floridani]|uniref:Calcium-transporting ATPase n=1 Tax=Ophiocordyceps camponoti-floridani TaxID=2030778 RepID=A0A8H4VFW8_9HYPO|nr:calcium-translocating P-type ATPase, PMCA-type [Ophiocordyceps camponoti-floridani]